jgi:hypothetical protein
MAMGMATAVTLLAMPLKDINTSKVKKNNENNQTIFKSRLNV